MSSLVKPTDKLQPFAAEGGIATSPAGSRDPFEMLDDLMAVIEALCPVWPQRETFAGATQFLL